MSSRESDGGPGGERDLPLDSKGGAMHEKWGGAKMPCSVGLGNCGCVRFQFGATMIHLGVDDFRSFAREALKLLISLSRGQETHPESSHTEVRH